MGISMGLQAMAGDSGQGQGGRDGTRMAAGDGAGKPDPAIAAQAVAEPAVVDPRQSGLRGRNLLLGGALVFLVLLLYAISFVKTPPGPGDGAPADAADRRPAAASQPVPATQPLSGIRTE